jgi:hypothetical protein
MRGFRFLLVLLAPPLLLSQIPLAANPPAEPPRLAVLVFVDQLRGDYLTLWQELFVADGFNRLMTEGAWYQNCHYPYAVTLTGAGHASVAAGCPPLKHGIIGNEWYDRKFADVVSCVGSLRYQRVPPAPPTPPAKEDTKDGKQDGKAPKKNRGQGSPDRLLSPTVADALKEATAGRAHVVSLSYKDRSAVLPGGHHPDACYWFDNSGLAVTSTYYRDRHHPWVAEFNGSRPSDAWFGRTWHRLRPDLDYVRWSGPDDVPGEGKGKGQGRTFPHPLTGGKERIGKDFYDALYNSPFGNDILLELVKRAVIGEHLGKNEVPDLLCVSFSCNDPVGHCWGPDSQEVLDVTLRTDLVLKDLLRFLDEQVGRGRYFVVLTADHGICPLPEVSKGKGMDAGRVSLDRLKKDAEAFLKAELGSTNEKDRWLDELSYPWLYLNHALIQERGLDVASVEARLARWLKQQPGIQDAYTRTAVRNGLPAEDAIGERYRLSFHPERSGDVAMALKPYYIYVDEFTTGTSHGAPHAYDTHVPLLVYGPGVRAGVRQEPVSPLSAAAILAHYLGIKPPADAEAAVPASLVR